MPKVAFLVPAVFLAALPAAAQAPRVAVDPRVELMSIIFRLAGNSEYNMGRVPAYNDAIDRWFAPYREHEAVKLARRLREEDGVSFDAVMGMAVTVKDIQTLAERIPFDAKASRLDGRWHGVKARAFLAEARKFAADTKFQQFLDSQAELYESTAAGLRTLTQKEADFAWFDKFFGMRAGARFFVVAGMANGGASYGPSLLAEDGVEESYAVLGVWQVDAAGRPTFSKGVVSTIVHEFTHSYANPLVDKAIPQIDGSGDRLFEPVREAMRQQAYGNGATVLRESLVRACSARYALAHDGPEAGRGAVAYERSRSFLWTGELFDLLGEYEKDRAKYPTLASFMPRVAAYFNALGPRVGEMVKTFEASRPKVASISPANGTADVDPTLTRIVVRFDRPMRKTSYAVTETAAKITPKIDRVGFDDSGTVFTIEVRLEADHDYEFGLNSQGGGSFASAEGVPLEFVRVRFHTRGASRE